MLHVMFNCLISFVPRSIDVKVSHKDGPLVQVLEYSDWISIWYFRHASNGIHLTERQWIWGRDKENISSSSVGCPREKKILLKFYWKYFEFKRSQSRCTSRIIFPMKNERTGIWCNTYQRFLTFSRVIVLQFKKTNN